MKIITVDLSAREVREEEFNQADYGFLGGRGLIARFLTDYCDPTCDPLGPENPLMFTTGFFCGTPLSSSARLSIGAKSPLTHGIKESNSGGMMAKRLNDQGIKLVMFTGQASSWLMCHIDAQGQVQLLDAAEYEGMWNYAFQEAIHERFGKNCSCASIGPAAEKGSLVGAIAVNEQATNHPCRIGARGGLGAVMASKHLKALLVDKAEKPWKFRLPEDQMVEFKQLNKVVTNAILANPLTGTTMRKYGSAAGVDTTGKMGALPWNNFSGRIAPEWEKLGTEQWAGRLEQFEGTGGIACSPGCVVACSNQMNAADGSVISAGIEYETVGLCGSNLGIFDPEMVARLDRLCDDMGMDTIDTGAALGLMMTKGILEYGDAEGAIAMLETVLDDSSEYGPVLRNGCAAVADFLHMEDDDIVRVPVAKRQAFAAYDPRLLRGYGLTWERGPMGADHTAGSAATYRSDLSPEEQADFSMATTCTCDCFMCVFPWAAVNYNPEAKAAISRMAGILAGYAEGPGPEMVLENGQKILDAEYAFNEKAGYKKKNELFYGGRKNYMYQVAAQATGAPYRSILDGAPEQTFTQVKIEQPATQKAAAAKDAE